MTSRSRILRFPALVLSMTVVATFLAMLAAGSASAVLPPCINPLDPSNPRIVVIGALSLSNCSISGNTTGGLGGGVENYGDLDLTNVVISGNHADGGGGGIYNAGTLTLTNVGVTGNTSLGFGGGIHNDGGTMFMSNVTVTGNTAGTGGGGIANLSSSAIGVGLTVANNTTTTGNGGGILNNNGGFCLSATDCFSSPGGGNSLVSGNHASAGNGGGIANDESTVILSDSTVDGNHAEGGDGGGIWSVGGGTIALVNATISNNTATRNGGGIFNDAGSVCCAGVNRYATNLTIAGNRAGGNGGGAYTTNGFTALGSSTIADNTATGAGGGVYNDDSSFATTQLTNTLLARNGVNCVGTIGSGSPTDGHNLDTGSTCALAGTGDQSNVGDANVGLGTLAANGGPTQGSSELFAAMKTQALTPTSPAVDAGSGNCPATDERGVTRPQDGNMDTTFTCDIGAYEYQAPTAPQTINVTTAAPAGAVFNTSFGVAATASSALDVAITTTGGCSGSGSGSATITMSSGTTACVVHYNQAGDSTYLAADEVTSSTTAQKASQVITVTPGAPATAAFNTAFPVAATAPGGSVVIAASGACSLSGSTVTMTSAKGKCTVTFNQAGNGNYLAAPQVKQTTTAQKASQTITVTQGAPATAAVKTSFPVAATASSGRSVKIEASGACSLKDGNTVETKKKPGTCTVTFDQNGNGNYLAAPQVVQITTVN